MEAEDGCANERKRRKALQQRRRAFEPFASERSFVGLWRLRGSVGLRFAAIEPAYDIGADGPRRNLRGLRLLAFAVRLFVGRADERAFNEDVSLWGATIYVHQRRADFFCCG